MSQEKTKEIRIIRTIENPKGGDISTKGRQRFSPGKVVKASRNNGDHHGFSYLLHNPGNRGKRLSAARGDQIVVLDNVTFETDADKKNSNYYNDTDHVCEWFIGTFVSSERYGITNKTPFNFYGNDDWAAEFHYMRGREDFKELGLNTRWQMSVSVNGREVVSAERVIMCATGVWATGIKYAEPYEWEIELGLQ